MGTCYHPTPEEMGFIAGIICKSVLISIRNVSFFLHQVANPARLFYLFTFLPLNVPAGKTEITIFAL